MDEIKFVEHVAQPTDLVRPNGEKVSLTTLPVVKQEANIDDVAAALGYVLRKVTEDTIFQHMMGKW